MDEFLDKDVTSEKGLNNQSQAFLLETAKWGKFLGIVGLVTSGIVTLSGLTATVFLTQLDGVITVAFIIGCLLITAIYFFSAYYLFQFSQKNEARFERR